MMVVFAGVDLIVDTEAHSSVVAAYDRHYGKNRSLSEQNFQCKLDLP